MIIPVKRTILTILLVLTFNAPGFSQTREINFDQIQKSNGVLHRIFNLYQDHNGFIWFRTAGNPGIQRYDGYEFVNFLDTAGFFTSIMEDRRGLFWLGSATGIGLFNPVNETLIRYYPVYESMQNSSGLNTIIKIIEDRTGTIWCATADGVLKLVPKKDPESLSAGEIFQAGIASTFDISAVKIKATPDSKVYQINDIFEDSKERLWIGGTGCLYMSGKDRSKFTRIDDDLYGNSRLSDPFVGNIQEESPDVLWAGTGNGLYRISNIEMAFGKDSMEKSRLEFKQYLEKKLIMGLLPENRYSFWIGTYINGLVHMKYTSDHQPEFEEMYPDLLEPEGEGIRTIFSLMKDRTGIIWAGHQYGGIRKFKPGDNYFTSYEQLVRHFFKNYDLNPIVKDAGDNLWIGTLGDGLHKIQSDGKVTNYYILDNRFPDKSGNGVISLLSIDRDIFWIGAANGVWQFDATTGKSLKLFTQTRFGELNNYVYDMVKIGNYILFIVWGEGLFAYNTLSGELRRYQYNPEDASGLKSNINFAIRRLRNGEVYVGGSKGLTRCAINTASGEISYLPLPFPADAADLPVAINQLLESGEGILWCGTSYGLFKLDLKSGTIRRWTSKDGLSFDIIRAIETDSRGNLWLGTSNGLSMLNTASGMIKVFNKIHGLPVEIHGHHASYRDRKGMLYFGGIGGFYTFHPDSIRFNNSLPPVVITDFRLFNKSLKPQQNKKAVLTTNISYTDEIKLKYNQHDISFEFAALDYYRSSENRYAYFLEGYQQDWIYTDADNRIASYTNLNPGKYVFRVKASNNDGVWNDEGASIAVVIYPPVWKTTWAYIAYGIFFLLLLRGYIFWRTWKLRKEKAVLEKQVLERTQKIQEQKEELLQQKGQLQSALENLQRTQEQLIESEKMAALGGLVAGVAHEINTPVGIGVTAISTLLDDINHIAEKFKKDEISRGDFMEFLQSAYDASQLIHKNLDRTAKLIQSFKQVSVDQLSEQQRKFLLKEYLIDIISSLKPKFKNMKINIQIHCDEKLELNSYPGVFAQIFTNLLLNSLQHGFHEQDKEGTIGIKANLKDEFLQILYSDDGAGISRKDLPHIFEPFYTSDQRKGAGLGLNIVYNLISRKLRGTVSCESEPGKGVLFKIELPVN